MERAVAAVDLRSLAMGVRHRSVVAINSTEAPRRAKLDEAVAEADAGVGARWCEREVPETPIRPGTWVERAIAAEDLNSLAVAVRDRGVVDINSADALRRAKLDEAVAVLDARRRRRRWG